jgi:hypothetical protein
LAIFRDRYRKQDLVQLFVLTAFPIHVWMIINMLFDVPSWLLYLNTGEILGMVSYSFSFALFETMILYLPLILMGVILPRRWTKDRFVPLASVWLIAATLIAFVLQLSIEYDWPKQLLLAGILPLLIGVSVFSLRYPKIPLFVRTLALRLTVLTLVYIALDIVGLLIVIVRNT